MALVEVLNHAERREIRPRFIIINFPLFYFYYNWVNFIINNAKELRGDFLGYLLVLGLNLLPVSLPYEVPLDQGATSVQIQRPLIVRALESADNGRYALFNNQLLSFVDFKADAVSAFADEYQLLYILLLHEDTSALVDLDWAQTLKNTLEEFGEHYVVVSVEAGLVRALPIPQFENLTKGVDELVEQKVRCDPA